MKMMSKTPVIYMLIQSVFYALKPFLGDTPFYGRAFYTSYSIKVFKNREKAEPSVITGFVEHNIYFRKYGICIAESLKVCIFKNE